MKVASTLVAVTFCAGAVSAFGLQASPKSTLKQVQRNAAFVDSGKAIVQPMDINGNRMDNSFVSFSTLGSMI